MNDTFYISQAFCLLFSVHTAHAVMTQARKCLFSNYHNILPTVVIQMRVVIFFYIFTVICTVQSSYVMLEIKCIKHSRAYDEILNNSENINAKTFIKN